MVADRSNFITLAQHTAPTIALVPDVRNGSKVGIATMSATRGKWTVGRQLEQPLPGGSCEARTRGNAAVARRASWRFVDISRAA